MGRKKTAKLIKGCWWKRSFIWSTLKSTWVGRPHTSYLVDCEMNTKAIKGFDQRTCIWIQTTWRQKKNILRGSYPADPFSSHLLWSAQCIKLHDAAARKIVKRSAARCYLKVHTSVAPTLGVTGIPGPGAERRMQPWSTHILALLSSDERQATLPPCTIPYSGTRQRRLCPRGSCTIQPICRIALHGICQAPAHL